MAAYSTDGAMEADPGTNPAVQPAPGSAVEGAGAVDSNGGRDAPVAAPAPTSGLPRKVDNLGRIVLPVELRRLYGIHAGDELEVSASGDAILLRKVVAGCALCESLEDLRSFKGKPLCGQCRSELGARPTEL